MSFLNKLFNTKKESKKGLEIKDTDTLGEIGYKLAKSGVISVPKNDNHNTFGEPLDKLVSGEIPWGWHAAKKDFYKPRDHKLADLSVRASKTDNIDEEIKLLKEFVDYFEEYKNECKLMGECFEKHFYDMNIHDGSVNGKPDYHWLNQNKERLSYLEENRDKLIEEQRNKNVALVDLPQRLKKVIIDNPGILQSEIYKQFDEIIKNEISSQLYYWANDGIIKREKCGKSYKIYYENK